MLSLRRFARYVPATLALCLVAAPAQAAQRPFTPHDLVMLDRLSDPQLSPDGAHVLYDLRSTDLKANRGRHATYEIDAAGGTPRRLTLTAGANTARWSPDGDSIYFLAPSKAGTMQLWRAGSSGQNATQVTSLPLDVQTYRIAPDGKHAVVALAVFNDCPTLECTEQRQVASQAKGATSARLYTRLFVRHWDTWSDHTNNHLYAVPLERGAKATTAVALMSGVDGDVPNKPFGDENDFAISPDGHSVVYSVRIAGNSEPWSTNFDLYRVSMDGSGRKNLTEANKAWDATPVFSPDGKWLAYRAQKRPAFESDRYGVWVMNVASGQTHEVDPNWDESASDLAWSPDGKLLYTSADYVQDHKLFTIDVASGNVKAVTGEGAVDAYQVRKNTLMFSQSSLRSVAQIFVSRNNAAAKKITGIDADKLAGVALSTPERFTFTGWNGDTVHGWVTKPYGFVSGKKYPVAFLIHGGPQGSWDNGWSYRWNVQTYAGHGYAVVQIDPHASTGYGQAFTDAVSQHWGDRPLEDLQKGWSAAQQQFPFLDGNRACALGASYGGYMVYWIAGAWNSPWKCLVDHDGVFDNRMMGYATEELWFSEWENGGTPWDHSAQYEEFNPITKVADWRVPMLIVHSDNDFRIPVDQGIAAFTALQRRGIPSEFLNFPDENHWVLKPANSLMWHQTVDSWLDRWLK